MKIENVIIKTVETEKLIDYLKIELKENEKLHIDKFGVWEDRFAIDSDCCFWELSNKHIENDVVAVIDVECRIKKFNKEGSYSMRMDKPDFSKTITLEEYLSISKEIHLIEFIRFNYNPRIQGNQKLLMQYIKEAQMIEPQE